MPTNRAIGRKQARYTPRGLLRTLDPAEWMTTVRAAMATARGRVPDAAVALGVRTRTLFVWLEDERFGDVPRASVGRRAKDATRR